MKNFLRIAIVIILLVGVGFGTYAIFFKPANDEAVFLALSEVNSEEEQETFDEMYKRLYFEISTPDGGTNTGTVKNAVSGDIMTTAFAKLYAEVINEYNPKLGLEKKSTEGITKFDFTSAPDDPVYSVDEVDVTLNSDGNVVKDSNGADVTQEISVMTFPALKNALDSTFANYVSYSQAVSKRVSKSELSEMKKLVEAYKNSFNDLNANFKSIESMINQICSTKDGEDWSTELEKRYQNAVVAYRSYVNTYANLTERVISFVREHVFEDSVVISDDSVMEEICVKYIKSFTGGAYSYSEKDDSLKKSKYNADMRNNYIITRGSRFIYLNYIGEDTVVYNSAVKEKYIAYFVDQLTIKVGVVDDQPNIATFNESGVQLPKTKYTVSDGKLYIFGETYTIDANGLVTIENVVFEQVDASLIMYPSSNYDKTFQISVTGSAKITASEIYFKDTGKYSIAYATKEYYMIDGNRYAVDSEGSVCKLDEKFEMTSEVLSGAVYNTYPRVDNCSADKSNLDEDLFEKSYENVYKTDKQYIDTIINLSLSDMSKLKYGNPDIISTFPEAIQSDLRVILAYFLGFNEEV